MVNGDGEPVPPQPGIPLLEGTLGEGEVGRVEEPVEAIDISNTMFDGPRIFVFAPQYEWHPEVHVKGQNKEAQQRIVAMKDLLHRFGYKTKVREYEFR